MKVRAFFISLLIVPALSEFLGLSGDSRTKDGGG